MDIYPDRREDGGDTVEYLILALILIAAYNATAAAMEWRGLKWSIVAYWICVGCYWCCKAAEIGG